MPDKFIYIKRTAPFVHDQINSELMKEELSNTKRSIGSYYASKNSSKIGTGLTPTEEDLLLPRQLQIQKSHPDYYKKFTDFYVDINTPIPGGLTGRKFNIGLTDNDKPLGEDLGNGLLNLPIDLMDYLRWRHCLGFPNTAISPEEAKGNPLVEYYQEDPMQTLEVNAGINDTKDRAILEYTKAKTDEKKVIQLLTVLKGYVRKQAGRAPFNINQSSPKERAIVLREIAVARPEKFYEAATDPDLFKRSVVESLLNVGLLARIGNNIVDVEDNNKVIGNTVKEAMINLFSATETQRIQRLKADFDKKVTRTKILV